MRVNVAIIGAGSVNWMRNIMRDFFQIEEFEGGTLRLVDPKKEYVAAVREMLLNFCRLKKKDFKVDIFEDRREALAGAEFVVCTFSPGSMDAFWYDLELPNIYGINLPVSMTVGIPGISAAIRRVYLIPPLLQQFLKTGERTGSIEPMLNSAANFYERELARARVSLVRWLEPCLIIFMGIVVGLLVISALLPLSELSAKL